MGQISMEKPSLPGSTLSGNQQQREFSRLCGRKDSWFSASRAVERDLSIGALITLTKALERMPPDRVPRSKRAKLKQLTRTLWLMIESKAMTPID